MVIDRRFLPGDQVEILFPSKESGGESVGTVKGTVHDGRVMVKFNNGNTAELLVGDLKRLDR